MSNRFLGRLLAAVRLCERFLGPDDDWVEDDRRIVYEAADPLLRRFLNRPTVREKGVADYICTARMSADDFEELVYKNGYQRNLLSTRKYRTHHGGGKQWAVGSWVYDTATTDWQHHVYLFETPQGNVEIYGHREASVRNPKQHEDASNMVHGDPNNRVTTLLHDNGFKTIQRFDNE